MKAILPAVLIAATLGTALPAGAASTTEAPMTLEAALLAAIHDEYHAEAFYAAVMDRFGAVRPFANIIRAERNHAEQVATLLKAHGFAVPKNDLLGSKDIVAAVPASLPAACSAAVKAEIDNRDLYDKKLLPAVAAYPDVTAVFQRLEQASNQNHLPAFQRCAGR